MNEVFVPPTIPTDGDTGNFNNPNLSNVVSSKESQGQWAKSVSRSRKIRSATNTVIKTRSQFKTYLQQNGLDLYTSAVEFQNTGNFIASSYVCYLNHNNYLEPLNSFLSRHPHLQQPVMQIAQSLVSASKDMQVVTKRDEY